MDILGGEGGGAGDQGGSAVLGLVLGLILALIMVCHFSVLFTLDECYLGLYQDGGIAGW